MSISPLGNDFFVKLCFFERKNIRFFSAILSIYAIIVVHIWQDFKLINFQITRIHLLWYLFYHRRCFLSLSVFTDSVHFLNLSDMIFTILLRRHGNQGWYLHSKHNTMKTQTSTIHFMKCSLQI